MTSEEKQLTLYRSWFKKQDLRQKLYDYLEYRRCLDLYGVDIRKKGEYNDGRRTD